MKKLIIYSISLSQYLRFAVNMAKDGADIRTNASDFTTRVLSPKPKVATNDNTLMRIEFDFPEEIHKDIEYHLNKETKSFIIE